jgi:hypothetical protein
MGLKLNGTHQMLAYADNVNLLEDIEAIKNTVTLIDVSKKVCIEDSFIHLFVPKIHVWLHSPRIQNKSHVMHKSCNTVTYNNRKAKEN